VGLVICCALAPLPARSDDAQAVRVLLRSAPAWQVTWSPPDERREYIAIVTFRERDGALMAESAHPGGAPCYPEIRVEVHAWGFLFHGCTGVPKEMRYDAADARTPFKGRAFGFTYRWQPSDGSRGTHRPEGRVSGEK
jgi:hypothetical protein